MADRYDRRVSTLIDAGLILASELDLDNLLQRIADLSRQVIGARYGAVGVVAPDGTLSRFVYSGIDREEADQIGRLPRGEGILGILIQEGRPLRLHNVSEHPRSVGFPPHHPSMHSFLGVPIMVRGRVYGRLYLTEKQGASSFSKDDERIALMFAAQAGVAIENAALYEEIRSRNEQLGQRIAELSSVERVGRLLISGEPVDDLLRSAAEEARKLTGATRATIVLADSQTGELRIRHAVGDPDSAALAGVVLPPGTSKAEAVMRRRRGEIVTNLAKDPEVDRDVIERLGSPRAGAFAPMLMPRRELGILAVYEMGAGSRFSSEELAVLQMLANQLAVALENARLTERLRDLAVLEERERISKELHDGVIQSIFSVGLSLQGSASLLERDTKAARQRINQAIAELDNVQRDVRNYIFELRPSLIEEKGLQATMEELIRETEVNTLVNTETHIDQQACMAVPEDAHGHVIQIVREVLANVARHAQASELRVTCEHENSEVILAIYDDGIEYDPKTAPRGQGLNNIEERARQLGATLLIERRQPKGMRHILRIPVDDREDGDEQTEE